MSRAFDAVLFDFGGVFTASPFAAFELAAAEIGAPPEQLVPLVFGSAGQPFIERIIRRDDQPNHTTSSSTFPSLVWCQARGLLVTQGLDGAQAGRPPGGVDAKDQPHGGGKAAAFGGQTTTGGEKTSAPPTNRR